jgi:hypothetical protein
LTALGAAAQVITAAITDPDCPRVIRVVAAKTGVTAVGDGTYAGAANSRYVTVWGVDVNGMEIYEDIPLNDVTAVNGKKAFREILSITLPIQANAGGGDEVSVGVGDVFGLEHNVYGTGDVLEMARKATAVTAYTVEAMGTVVVGSAASTINNTGGISASATSITLASATGWPAVANTAARIFGRIYAKDGTYEDIAVILRAAAVLTVVRGVNGTTARVWAKGTDIVWVAPMTIAWTTVHNDRMLVTYKTKEI